MFLQFFADTHQANRHIFRAYTHNFPDFIVTQVLQPKHDYRSVKQPKLLNPLVEHLHLLHIFVVFIKQINVHRQRDTLAASFLFSVH